MTTQRPIIVFLSLLVLAALETSTRGQTGPVTAGEQAATSEGPVGPRDSSVAVALGELTDTLSSVDAALAEQAKSFEEAAAAVEAYAKAKVAPDADAAKLLVEARAASAKLAAAREGLEAGFERMSEATERAFGATQRTVLAADADESSRQQEAKAPIAEHEAALADLFNKMTAEENPRRLARLKRQFGTRMAAKRRAEQRATRYAKSSGKLLPPGVEDAMDGALVAAEARFMAVVDEVREAELSLNDDIAQFEIAEAVGETEKVLAAFADANERLSRNPISAASGGGGGSAPARAVSKAARSLDQRVRQLGGAADAAGELEPTPAEVEAELKRRAAAAAGSVTTAAPSEPAGDNR
jgi:hypothetical protein